MSVSGVSAYLVAQDSVKNTFVIARGNLECDFTIQEHKIKDENKDGVYELSDEEVYGNTYSVYPGVDIPKDPFIRLKELKCNSYMYVEVVDSGDGQGYEWDVNDNWLETSLEGTKGGKVYVYKGDSDNAVVLDIDTGYDLEVFILEGIDSNGNGGVRIKDDYSSDGLKLEFYGYLIEARDSNDYEVTFNSSL